MIRRERSAALYQRARRRMVGGVSSPVRAFQAVGGYPLFIAKGKGSKVWDVDGNRFIDYVCSWGALILGHSNPRVTRRVRSAIYSGSSFGAPTEPELVLAEEICRRVPTIEKVRFVNSGTEATMSAIRVARAYTKRDVVLKFEGGYHGHADPFLGLAGSGVATFDTPMSPGVPMRSVSDTITIPYNSEEAVATAFREHRRKIAAVIVEPVAGNMGVVPPNSDFLRFIRQQCDNDDSLLIFDEVITGFRVSMGGAQELYSVEPDITCLGKIIGGGFPVGAYGGRSEIMRLISPEGPVYQAGTLAGNPVAMTAGLATLSLLNEQAYRGLESISSELQKSIQEAADRNGAPVRLNRVGSMLSIFFTRAKVASFTDVKRSGHANYRRFFWRMLERGVYLPPSPYESLFVSTSHTRRDVAATARAADAALR